MEKFTSSFVKKTERLTKRKESTEEVNKKLMDHINIGTTGAKDGKPATGKELKMATGEMEKWTSQHNIKMRIAEQDADNLSSMLKDINDAYNGYREAKGSRFSFSSSSDATSKYSELKESVKKYSEYVERIRHKIQDQPQRKPVPPGTGLGRGFGTISDRTRPTKFPKVGLSTELVREESDEE